MSARRKWSQAAVVAAVGLLVACPEEFPQKPQIRVQLNPNPFDFGKAFVGTSRQSSMAITNKGLEDLVITQVRLTGDSAFARYVPTDGSPNPTIPSSDAGVPSGALTLVPANKSSYYVLTFTPPAVGTYSGNVNIASNAENAPSQDIPVLGEGVAP